MTYKQVYDYGVQLLQEANIEEATLDARLLLEHICKTTRNDLLVHGQKEVAKEELQQYEEVIQKRSTRLPLAYIIGEQEFMGLPFLVNENVLIPRQDTEILVEEAMLVTHDGMRILDICTGSGCILLSLLHYKNDCEGVGLDISKEALFIASENAKKLQIEADFRQSDLLEKADGKFDVVVSNPPYIRSSVIPTLMEEVKTYEPMIALDGKEDGLYFYQEITKQVIPFLKRGSVLLFEIGHDQSQEVEEILHKAGFLDIKTMKDFAGLDRVVTGTFLEEICLIS